MRINSLFSNSVIRIQRFIESANLKTGEMTRAWKWPISPTFLSQNWVDSVCHSTDISMVAKNSQSNHVREWIVPRINLESDPINCHPSICQKGTSLWLELPLLARSSRQRLGGWQIWWFSITPNTTRARANKSKSSDILLEREADKRKTVCGAGNASELQLFLFETAKAIHFHNQKTPSVVHLTIYRELTLGTKPRVGT